MSVSAYLPSIEALEEDDPDRPDVHFVRDLRRLLAHHKTLWGKVPGQEEWENMEGNIPKKTLNITVCVMSLTSMCQLPVR